jgi:hypothetical protein
MRERGIALTQVGECCNLECRAPLFAELMIFSDDEACYECDPPREGWHTVIIEAFGDMLPPFDSWSADGQGF